MRSVDLAYLIMTASATVLMLVPFVAHFRAWNAATCYMMLYASLGCIIQFTNTLIWHDNITDWAPLWCDISTKLSIGISVGLPLASMAINRRLAGLRNATASPHPNARRRDALIDTLICFVPVLLMMGIHYIFQGHRYDIIESFGCWPSTYVTEPALVFVILPPMLISFISCIYACLSIQFFWRRQREFEKFLRNSSNNMSRSTYTRLMLMSAVEITISLPVTIVFFAIAVKRGGVAHWISWEDTKWGFNRHDSYTRWMIENSGPSAIGAFETSRWLYPFCCFLFFAFFGFSKEVFRSYYDLVARISLKVFGKRMPTWDERNTTQTRSTAAPSQPFTFTVFGRTIAIYGRGSWKKATETTLNNSVSVALPQHAGNYNSATGRKQRANSLSFMSGDFEDAMKHEYSAHSPTSDAASSLNEKEIADYLADLPVLESGGLDIPAPARAHTRSPSRASEQLSIHVDVERAEARI